VIGYIYKITNIINGKLYIGQTVDYSRRVKSHKSAALKLSNGESVYGHLYRAMVKYGINNFTFEQLFIVFDAADLNTYEMLFIAELSTLSEGYNCNVGGGSSFGFKHTEFTKAKMSKSKYLNNWQRGRPLSREHKLAMSLKLSGELNPFYGKTHTEDIKNFISRIHKGKKLQDSHRAILSKHNSGEGNPMYGKLRPEVASLNKALKGDKIVYDKIVYESMREMASELHVSRETITKWIKSGKAIKLPKEPK